MINVGDHASHCRMAREIIIILKRTYDTDEHLYISLLLLTIFGPIHYHTVPVVMVEKKTRACVYVLLIFSRDNQLPGMIYL